MTEMLPPASVVRTSLHGSDDGGTPQRLYSDVRLGYLAGAGPGAHLVQFYDEETFLCDAVAEYASAGLAAGDPIVIIATAAHQRAFAAALRPRSFDLDHAQASRQLTLLDADETLAKFMRGGAP